MIEVLRDSWPWAQAEGIEALHQTTPAFTVRMYGVVFDDDGEPRGGLLPQPPAQLSSSGLMER